MHPLILINNRHGVYLQQSRVKKEGTSRRFRKISSILALFGLEETVKAVNKTIDKTKSIESFKQMV